MGGLALANRRLCVITVNVPGGVAGALCAVAVNGTRPALPTTKTSVAMTR